MNSTTIPLSELEIGKSATISEININGPFKLRLMEMGIVKGVNISARRAAPLGDPVAYAIKGYQLSLRREDAKNILVQISPAL